MTHARMVEQKIRDQGIWTDPILVAAKYFIVLDGHHRFESAKAIGLDFVPCVVIDYLSDVIEVSSWRHAVSVTKNDVLVAGLQSKLLPAKTSKHTLSQQMPSIDIPLINLTDIPGRPFGTISQHEEVSADAV